MKNFHKYIIMNYIQQLQCLDNLHQYTTHQGSTCLLKTQTVDGRYTDP